MEVQREWLRDRQVQTGDQIASDSATIVMQRWHQESMRDQPYNNIGGVVAGGYET